jgi:tRNA(fMet)-specific endonuclease VapC
VIELIADTNVISFIAGHKKERDAYRRLTAGRDLGITFFTLAELMYGVTNSNWGAKRILELWTVLDTVEIIHTNNEICHFYAEVTYATRRQPIGIADAWIAACAIAYDLPIVTHNAREFRRVPGLQVLSAN